MLVVAPEVVRALAERRAVVALESAVLTHGLPRAAAAEAAGEIRAAVRAADAVPAVTAVLDGAARVGLADEALARLVADDGARKCGPRELAAACAAGWAGGTTVGAALVLANAAGIRVFATGGIGGVHPGAAHDVSADLAVLGRTPMVVVCSGPKTLLDLPATLERLETEGVAVLGWRTDRLPAFHLRDGGLPVTLRVDGPEGVVEVVRARDALAQSPAIVVAVPVPEAAALPAREVVEAIARAQGEAEAAGVTGGALTPFVLARMAELTEGRSLAANRALLVENARVAAAVAHALDAGRPRLRLV